MEEKNHLAWVGLEQDNVDEDKMQEEVAQELEEIYGTAPKRKEEENKKTTTAVFTNEAEEVATPTRAHLALEEEYTGPVIQLYTPLSYADTQTIALNLCRKQVAIIDFSQMEATVAGRVVDFLTGLVYGLEGDIVHFSEKKYICSGQGIILDEAFLSRFQATEE